MVAVARSVPDPQRPVVDRHALVDGARLALRDEGTGPPVVLVHGTPSHSVIWRDVLPALVARGRRVVCYDLLGYGASERPVQRDTSVTAQAGLLTGLLDELGLDRIDLVGHDIGGAVALRLATSQPERLRRLILADTVSYDSWPSETWREIIDAHLDRYEAMPLDDFRELMTRQLRMTVADPQRMSGDVLEAYLAPLVSTLGKASFFRHQVAHYDSRHTEEITHLLPELDLPTLVVWGEDDRWQPLSYADRLVRDIPGAELRTIPDAGHFLTEDAPAAFVEAVSGFLDR